MPLSCSAALYNKNTHFLKDLQLKLLTDLITKNRNAKDQLGMVVKEIIVDSRFFFFLLNLYFS